MSLAIRQASIFKTLKIDNFKPFFGYIRLNLKTLNSAIMLVHLNLFGVVNPQIRFDKPKAHFYSGNLIFIKFSELNFYNFN